MATADEYAAWIVKNADKRGTPEFDTVASAYKDARRSAAPVEQYNPASDSFFGNLLPAAGAGMASIGRAVGLGGVMQRFGLPGTKEEADRLEAPLNAAPGGTTGRVLGAAALLAPTAFIPGANTLAGAAAIGGGTGLATTEGGLEDRLKGAAYGTAGAGAGNLLGRALAAGGGLVKGLVQPFSQGGRDSIAGKAIGRFATDKAAVMRSPTGPTVTGAMPTLAEASKDTGLASLQRAIGTMDPAAAADFAARAEANNAARINALRQVSGEVPGEFIAGGKPLSIYLGPTLDAAKAARKSAADASYGAARKAGVSGEMTSAMAPQIESLMQRPSIQAAVEGAKKLAKEEGIDLTDIGSAQGLQYVKQSLDDMIGALGPKEGNKIRLLSQTSADLKSVLDEIAPRLRMADAEFARNSIPVNRAAVGQRLADSTSGAIRDFSGNRRLQANQFSRALNNEEQLMRQATGRKNVPSSLDDLMTPMQMSRINAVRDELETAANLSQAANGPGSQTAKMLASQNLLGNIAGPFGIPRSWTSSTIAQTLMRAPQFAMKNAEERIHQSIAQGLLSPVEGKRLLQIALKAENASPSELGLLAKALAPSALGYQAAQYGQQ